MKNHMENEMETTIYRVMQTIGIVLALFGGDSDPK